MKNDFTCSTIYYICMKMDFSTPPFYVPEALAEAPPEDIFSYIEELEESIQKKTAAFQQSASCQLRILKAGVFWNKPLYIYSPPLLARRFAPCLGAERLAYLFSLAGPTLPENFHNAVKRILFLPELVLSPKHLLTHVYIPQTKLLVFYLSPKRFLPGRLSLEDFEKQERLQTRLGKEKNSLALLEIWGWALNRSLQCWLSASSCNHKFLLESIFLSSGDITPLKEIDEMYARKTIGLHAHLPPASSYRTDYAFS